MKLYNEIAYIRQLCCLGLGREILIQEFLKAVQSVIPSGNNFFIGLDKVGNPTYCLTDTSAKGLQETAKQVVPEFFTEKKRSQVYNYFNHFPAITDHGILDEHFFHTEFYQSLWQPRNLHHFVLVPVLVNRKLAGMFFLFRSREILPFTASEQALSIRLSGYIARALQEKSNVNPGYSESGQSSMAILDSQGTVLHLNPMAKKLLNLMKMEANYPNQPDFCLFKSLLSRYIANSCLRKKDSCAPILTHSNLNGRFIFRVYRLDHLTDEQSNLFGITIEHQEPLTLKIARNLQFQPLSIKEKEVALLYVQKFSQKQIGDFLNIKLSTVKHHVGNIYTKLDISDRDQLLTKLLI